MNEPTQRHAVEAELPAGVSQSSAAEIPSEAALVPSVMDPGLEEGLRLNERVARLPVELDVAIPVRGFRVRNLLSLEAGRVIQTQWQQGEDMPLAARDAQLAWSEFEVIDSRLAVRVTRLA
jgi:flagellar motor switch protein FliN/FliY